MKKLLLVVAMAAAAIAGSVASAAEKYNVVRIDRVDGVREHLLLDENLDIRIGEQGSLLLVHPEITVEYEISEIGSMSVAYVDDAALYDGDHESGISTPEAPERLIRITEEAIAAGADDVITAYDLKGRKVASAKERLDLTRLPAGAVYIVRIGSTSLKIKR